MELNNDIIAMTDGKLVNFVGCERPHPFLHYGSTLNFCGKLKSAAYLTDWL